MTQTTTTELETADGRHAEKLRRAAEFESLTLFDRPAAPLHIIIPRDGIHQARVVLLLGELYGHGSWLRARIGLREATDGDYTCRLLGHPEDDDR